MRGGPARGRAVPLLAALAACAIAGSAARAAAPDSVAMARFAGLKRMELEVLRGEPARELREGPARALRDRRPRGLDAAAPAGLSPAVPLRLAGPASGAPLNVRLNDRAAEHALLSAQEEPGLAAHGSWAVAGWNDGESVNTGGNGLALGVSRDGGASWRDLGAPPRDSVVALWTSDPVVAVDERRARFLFAGLVITADARNGIGVVRAVPSDTGLVLEPPVIARSVRDTLPDKPWVALDSLSGCAYLVYTTFFFRQDSMSDEIEFQRSEDGGASWSPPQVLSPEAEAGFVHGARPAVGPDGEVHVAWKTVDTSWTSGGRDWIRVRSSHDGGCSFRPTFTVTDLFTNFGSGAPGYNRPYGFAFPGLAVDRSAGPYRGRIYAVWSESVPFYGDSLGRGDAVLEQEPNNTTIAASPIFVGQTVRGRIEDSNDVDLYRFNGSRGQTVVFYLDSLDAHLDVALRILCGDGQTRLAYCATPNGRRRLAVFTLPADGDYLLRISPESVEGGGYRVLSAFHAPAPGRARDHRDVFVAHSDDGFRWSAPVRVNDDGPWLDDWLPEVGVSATGKVVVAWYDWRDTPSVFCGGTSVTYLSISSDGGETWSANEPVADAPSFWSNVGSNGIPNQGDYIGLAVSGDSAWVTWADGRNGDPDIYGAVRGLADHGAPAGTPAALALDGPWPHPISGPIALRLRVPVAAPATIEVLDAAGRRRLEQRVDPRGAGWVWVDLRGSAGLEPGLYFVRARQGAASATRRVIVLK